MLYLQVKFVPSKSKIESEGDMIEVLRQFKSEFDVVSKERAPLEELVGRAEKSEIIRVQGTDRIGSSEGYEIDVGEFVKLCHEYRVESERICQNCKQIGKAHHVGETWFFCKEYETKEEVNERKPVSQKIEDGALECPVYKNRFLQSQNGSVKPLSELVKIVANE